MHTISGRLLTMTAILMGLFSPMRVLADGSQQSTAAPDLPTQPTRTTQDNASSPGSALRQLHTRSLAATCAACHSTHQNSPTSTAIYLPLYGMDTTYFISQMLAFKSGERPSTVMQRHAKGLNAEELADLSEYFAAQKLGAAQALPQQKLLKTHPH